MHRENVYKILTIWFDFKLKWNMISKVIEYENVWEVFDKSSSYKCKVTNMINYDLIHSYIKIYRNTQDNWVISGFLKKTPHNITFL